MSGLTILVLINDRIGQCKAFSAVNSQNILAEKKLIFILGKPGFGTNKTTGKNMECDFLILLKVPSTLRASANPGTFYRKNTGSEFQATLEIGKDVVKSTVYH